MINIFAVGLIVKTMPTHLPLINEYFFVSLKPNQKIINIMFSEIVFTPIIAKSCKTAPVQNGIELTRIDL